MITEQQKDKAVWKVMESEYISRRPWLTVRRERLKLPNGNELPEYYVLEYPDWVNVIAITEDGQLVLERQYRHALGCTAWEIPGGTLEKTDASPLEGAKRELLEETGFGGGEWFLFDKISSNPACTNNLTHCFLARGVKKISGQHLDVGEDIEVKLFPVEDLPEMLLRGDFIQALNTSPLWKFSYMQKVLHCG